MLKNCKPLILGLCLAFFLSPAAGAAESVKINDLIENTRVYDGKEVTVTGEALGEALERGDFAWVNINDGSNAAGIWMSLADAQKIRYFGDYKNKGDQIRVTGVFSRDCREHGGDVDIHCTSLEITAPGHPVSETLEPMRVIGGTALFFATLALAFFCRKALKKSGEKL